MKKSVMNKNMMKKSVINRRTVAITVGTIGLFLLVLPFLPSDLVVHIDGNGVPTNFQNKYLFFLFFSVIDIVGSIFWVTLLKTRVAFFEMVSHKLNELIVLYFPVLMLTLLLMSLSATLKLISPMIIFFSIHGLYAVALVYAIFVNRNR